MIGRPVRTSDAVIAASLAAVVVALPSLANGFALDDVWIVAQNPVVRAPGSIGRLLTSTYWPATEGHGALWRPITITAFAIQWMVGGGAPLVFHVVTLVLAGIAAGLVAAVAGALFGPGIALVAGVLFAVHPVHVEVTATVVGQAELWAAIAYFGAALAAWRAAGATASRARMGWAGIMALAVLLGLGAKEHVVTFPLALVLVWWRRAAVDRRALREVFRQQLPGVLLVAMSIGLYLLGRAAVAGGAADTGGIATGLDPGSPWQRLAVMVPVSLRWLELLFVPWRLSADYGPQHVVPDARFGLLHGLAVVVWATLAVVAWRARSRAPAISFGVAWFAVTVAIVSNVVVPLEVLLAERLLYLPSAGWAVAVAGAAGLAATVMHRRTALVAAVVAVAVAFGMRSAWRAPVWRSNETLYAQMLREAPDSYRTHWGLGALAFARGDSAAGERAWRDAIRLNPADPQPLEDLGRLYARTGRWADAVPLLERVIARDSSRIGSALALGTAYLRTNRLDAAGELLTAMGARHAAEPMFPAMLAGLRRRQGDYGGAVDAAREAVRRDSADWQLWLLAAETAGLAGDCAMLNEMAAGARRLGGLEAERTIEQVLAGVANRNGSCK